MASVCGPDNMQTFLGRESMHLEGVSLQVFINSELFFVYLSSVVGRTPVHPQTQPTVPKFHNASKDNSKAGST